MNKFPCLHKNTHQVNFNGFCLFHYLINVVEAEKILFFLQNMKEYENISTQFQEKRLITIRWDKTEEIDAQKDCDEITKVFHEKGFQIFDLILQNECLKKDYGLYADLYFQIDLFLNPMQKIIEKFNKNDLIILFYSGHGILDESKILVLSPGSKKQEKIRSGIEFKRIREFFDNLTGPMLYILDCCYGGAAYRGPEKKIEFILASSGSASYAPTYSSFTQEICNLIKDKNSEEFDLNKLFNALLKKNLKSTPVLLNMGIGGDLSFKWSATDKKQEISKDLAIIELIIHFDANEELLTVIMEKLVFLASKLDFQIEKDCCYKLMMGNSITTIVVFKIQEHFGRFLQGILPENVAFRIKK